MLEKYISNLLVPYLSKYAENIDPKQLNISLWNGSASLKDLVLKRELIDDMDLPFVLQRGVCKNIKFDIPIANLSSKPLLVEINQVLLCLVSTLSKPSSRDNDREREQRAKEASLQTFEEERKKKLMEKSETTTGKSSSNAEQDGSTMVSRLTERILHNVVVKIRSLHIRLEDPETSTIVGFVLGNVRLVTTNENGVEQFVDPTAATVHQSHKLLDFEGLEVYCYDPDVVDRILSGGGRSWSATSLVYISSESDPKRWEERMNQRIVAQQTSGGGQLVAATEESTTVFGPVSGSVKASLVLQRHLKHMTDTPYLKASVRLQNVITQFSRGQYAAILTLTSKLGSWKTLQPVMRLRPPEEQRQHKDISVRCRALWTFLARCIRSVVYRVRLKAMKHRASKACIVDYERLYYQSIMSPFCVKCGREGVNASTHSSSCDHPDCHGKSQCCSQEEGEGDEDGVSRRRKITCGKCGKENANKATHPANCSHRACHSKTITRCLEETGIAADEVEPAAGASRLPSTTPKKYSCGKCRKDGVNKATHHADCNHQACQGKTTTRCQVSLFRFCEHCLTAVDMISARKRVYSRIVAEVAAKREEKAATLALLGSSEVKKPASSGFSLFGWGSSKKKEATETPQSPADMSWDAVEQEYGLQDRLEDDDYETVRANLPKTYRWVELDVELPTCGVSVDMGKKRDANGRVYHQKSDLRFQRVAVTFDMYNASGSFRFRMDSHDMTMTHPRAAAPSSKLTPMILTRLSSNTLAAAQPLFHVDCMIAPPVSRLPGVTLDVDMVIRLLPLRLYLDPETLNDFIAFFEFPADLNLSEMTRGARDLVNRAQEAAASSIGSAVATSKSMMIDFDATAPLVIVTTAVNEPSQPCICCSLGRVQLNTEPMSDIEKARRALAIGEGNANQLDKLMFYSSNKATLSNVFAYVSTIGSSLQDPRSGFALLPEVEVEAEVLQRIIPSAVQFEPLLVEAASPCVKVALSLHQTYLLSVVMESWTSTWAERQPVVQRGVGAIVPVSPSSPQPSSDTTASPTARTPTSSSGASYSSVAASPHAAPLDLPTIACQLRVAALSIALHHDHADGRTMATPWCSLDAGDAVVGFHKSSLSTNITLAMQNLRSATADGALVIGGGACLEYRQSMRLGAPSTIFACIKPTVQLYFGTPVMEITEYILDAVHLLLPPAAAQSSSPLPGTARGDDPVFAGSVHFHQRADCAASIGAGAEDDEDQPLQEMFCDEALERGLSPCTVCCVGVVPPSVPQPSAGSKTATQLCSQTIPPLHQTMIIEVVLEGVALTMCSRDGRIMPQTNAVDFPMATAKASRVTCIVELSPTGLEVRGDVDDVMLWLEPSAFSLPFLHRDEALLHKRRSKKEISSSSTSSSKPQQAEERPLVRYLFRTTTHVSGPVYNSMKGRRDGQPRRVINGSEIGFSKLCEVDVGEAEGTFDMHSIMILLDYFTSGYFLRITEVADRPRYDGKEIPKPPTSAQTLLKLKVTVAPAYLRLPTRPDRPSGEGAYFVASFQQLTIENALHVEKLGTTMDIALSGMEIRLLPSDTMTTPKASSEVTTILPATSLVVSLSGTFDPTAVASSRLVEVKSPSLAVHVDSALFVDVVNFVISNVLRMPTPEEMAKLHYDRKNYLPSLNTTITMNNNSMVYASSSSDFTQCQSTIVMDSNHHDQHHQQQQQKSNTVVMILFDQVQLSLLNQLYQPHFDARVKNLRVDLLPQNDQKSIAWDDLSIEDVRFGVPTRLLTSLASSVELFPVLTTTSGNAAKASTSESAALRIEVGLSIDRFAVSDQWLDVYDFVINEAVMAALKPLTHPAPSTAAPSTSSNQPPPPPSSKDIEVRFQANRFVIPFLDNARCVLFTASVSSLSVEVDVKDSDNSTEVRIDVPRVSLRHQRTGYEMLTCVSGDRSPLDGLSSHSAQSSPDRSQEEPSSSLLSVKLRTIPGHTSVGVTLCRLHAKVAMPMLHEIIEYTTHPNQPISKIAQLGVMKEERDRIAQLTLEKVNKSEMTVTLQWSQPSIVLVGDALNLQDETHNLTLSLGELTTKVKLNKAKERIDVTCALSRVFLVGGGLGETDCSVEYHSTATREDIVATLPSAKAYISKHLLESILWCMQRNIALPSSVEEGGGATTTREAVVVPVVQQQQQQEASSLSSTDTNSTRIVSSSSPPPPAKERHVTFINPHGIEAFLTDIQNRPSVTLLLKSLEATVAPDSSVTACVRGLTVKETTSGLPVFICGSDMVSLRLFITAGGHKSIVVADTSLYLVPQVIGSIVNITLGLEGPPPLTEAVRGGAGGAGGVAATTSSDLKVSPSTTVAPPPPPPASSLQGSTLFVSMERSCVFLLRGGRKVCMFSVSGATMCNAIASPVALTEKASQPTNVKATPSLSSSLQVWIAAIHADDMWSLNTRYKSFLFPSEGHPSSVAAETASVVEGNGVLTAGDISTCRAVVASLAAAGGSGESRQMMGLTLVQWTSVERLLSTPRTILSQFPLEQLRIALQHAVDSSSFAMIRLTTFNHPQPISSAATVSSTFSQKLECKISSVSLVILPQLFKEIGGCVSDLTSLVTDVAHQNAKRLASEQATELSRKNQDTLTDFAIDVQRPRVIIISQPTSVDCIEVFPGAFSVSTSLTRETPAIRRSSASLLAVTAVEEEEYFDVVSIQATVNGCEVRVNGESIFHNPKPLHAKYATPVTVGSSNTTTDSTSIPSIFSPKKLIVVEVPKLEVAISKRQLYYLYDVLGEVLRDERADAIDGDDADRLLSVGQQESHVDVMDMMETYGIPVTQDEETSAGSQAQVPPADSSSRQADVPHGEGSLLPWHACISLHSLTVDVAAMFALRVRNLELTYQTVGIAADAKSTIIQVDEMSLTHSPVSTNSAIGSEVLREFQSTTTTTTTPSPPLNTLQIVQISGLVLKQQVHRSRLEFAIEHVIDGSIQHASLSLTPCAVRDAVGVLYEPFSAKVLHSLLRPQVVVCLDTVHRVKLSKDTVLDERHLLIAHNHKLRTYEVDLQGHRLVLKGSPKPLIILHEGCQVLFTNGIIFVTGAYSLSSFVQYGLQTVVGCSPTCSVRKRMYNSAARSLVASAPPPEPSFLATQEPPTVQADGVSPRRIVKPGVSMAPSSLSHSRQHSRTESNVPSHPPPPQDTHHELSTVFLVNLKVCPTIHILSDDFLFDLGVVAHAAVTYTRRSTGRLLDQQNLMCTLDSLRTTDECTLRPTKLSFSMSGVDGFAIRTQLSRLEVFLNTMFVKRLLLVLDELQRAWAGVGGSDGGAHTESKEETQTVATSGTDVNKATSSSPPAVVMHLHQVDFEDENGIPLREVVRRGVCRLCREKTASLAHEAGEAGFLCWRCTTGRRTIVTASLDAQLDLVDIVLANNRSEMLQLRMDHITAALEDSVNFVVRAKGQLWSFNRSFSTWEPLVEHISGNVTTHQIDKTMQVVIERLDFVLTLPSILLARSMLEDLTTPVIMHSHQGGGGGTAAVSSGKLQPVVGVAAASSVAAADAVANSSMTTVLFIRNRCYESIGVDDVQVALQASAELSTSQRRVRIHRTFTSDRITVGVERSAYFGLGTDVVIEVLTMVSPDGVSLSVELNVLPLHLATQTFILIRNLLPMAVQPLGIPVRIEPNETLFLPSNYTMHGTFHVVPQSPLPDEVYSQSETHCSPPTIADILSGYAFRMTSNLTTATGGAVASSSLYMKTSHLSDEPVGGVPTHVVVIESAIQVVNSLCCTVDVAFYRLEKDGGGVTLPLETVICEPSATVRPLRVPSLEGVRVAISVHVQCSSLGDRTKPITTYAATASQPRNTILSLRSANQDVLRVQVNAENDVLRLSSPYAIVNHTPFALEVEDYSAAGKIVSTMGVVSRRKTSYSHLPPNMTCPIPAFPDDDKLFLVTMAHTNPQTGAVFQAQELPFHVPGVVSQIRLCDAKSKQVMNLVFFTWLDASGTRVVEITPRWILVNRLQRPLFVAQQLGNDAVCNVLSVPAASSAPFVMTQRVTLNNNSSSSPVTATGGDTNEPGVQVRLSQYAVVTPGIAISVEEIGNNVTVARGEHHATQPDVMLDVAVTIEGPYTYIILEEPLTPPYVFFNRTSIRMNVRATTTDRQLCVVPGYEMAHFAFETLSGGAGSGANPTPAAAANNAAMMIRSLQENQHAITVQIGMTDVKIDLRLSRRSDPQPVVVTLSDNSQFEIIATVSPGSRGQRIIEISPSARQDDWKPAPAPTVSFEGLLNIKSLCVSVVHDVREIVSGLFEDVRAHIKRSEHREIFQLSVTGIQFDNQLEEKPVYEAALYAIRKDKDQSAIALFVERTIVRAPSVVNIEEIRFDVAPIAVRVSDDMLMNILSLMKAWSRTGDASATISSLQNSWSLCPTMASLFENSPKAAGWRAAQMNIERIVMNPITLRVWFIRSGNQDIIRYQLKDRQSATLISMMVGTLEDVEVTAPGITARNENRHVHLQIQRFTDFYADGFKRQLVALGFQFASSLPLIGVPIRLVTDVGNGAIMFFKEPIVGLVDSPEAFAKGLAKGSVGLLGNIVGGGFNAISSVANTTANVARIASGTSKREHRESNTLTGLVSGITGVVTKPIQGFAEDGAMGLFKGIGKGFVGLAAAPVSGVMSDLGKVTNVVATVLSDKYIAESKRLRPQRLFHANGAIAQFGSLAQSIEFQRRPHAQATWSADELLPTDGPVWYPKTRDQLQAELKFPADRWKAETYGATIDGWRYGDRYYGDDAFEASIKSNSHVRRRRWVAVVREHPPSAVAPHALSLVNVHESNFSFTNVGNRSRQGSSVASSGHHPNSAQVLSHNYSIASGSTERRASLPPGSIVQPPTSPLVHDETRMVEVFENERKYPLKGWSTSLLPTDRPRWSSRDGKLAMSLDTYPLEPGWQWAGEWQVYKGEGADTNGWSYAMDFPAKYGPKESMLDYVRRRCWRRVMKHAQSDGSSSSSLARQK